MTKLRNTHFIGRIIRRFGTVTRYFIKDKGYGFIRGDNGKSYFIHNSKLNGEYIERDYYVFFRPFHSNKGECAEIISVIESPERSK